jgi:hypothetical protein
VTDQSPDFLRLLEKHGLMPGRRLAVHARDAVADTVEVVPEDGAPLRLGSGRPRRSWSSRPGSEGSMETAGLLLFGVLVGCASAFTGLGGGFWWFPS